MKKHSKQTAYKLIFKFAPVHSQGKLNCLPKPGWRMTYQSSNTDAVRRDSPESQKFKQLSFILRKHDGEQLEICTNHPRLSLLKVKVKSLRRVRLFATSWTVAHQTPPSMGFSRQEYWNGLPFPSPGNLPDPGIEPRSPAFKKHN